MIGFLTDLLDIILPRFCPVCGRRIYRGEIFMCTRCCLSYGMSGVFGNSEDNIMTMTLMLQFNICRANAMFKFIPGVGLAHLIYKLKYKQRPDIGVHLGKRLALELQASDFFQGIDIIVPVPLTKRRKRQRGYNQAEMIARGINEITEIPIDTRIIRRNKFSKSQTTMNYWMRHDNVEDVFSLCEGADVAGKHLLLVDDVFTTGSTITQCCKAIAGDSRDNPLGITFSVLTLGIAHF